MHLFDRDLMIQKAKVPSAAEPVHTTGAAAAEGPDNQHEYYSHGEDD